MHSVKTAVILNVIPCSVVDVYIYSHLNTVVTAMMTSNLTVFAINSTRLYKAVVCSLRGNDCLRGSISLETRYPSECQKCRYNLLSYVIGKGS